MVPKNFLKDERVTCRTRDDIEEGWVQYSTHGDHGLLKTLPRWKPNDAYAVIGLTNEDLYPSKSWNFCFGWAMYNTGVGAFSFCRYDPSFDGIDTSDDPDAETTLLMRGCHIMAHELGHMFGLKHCIYYECLMNGLNSAEEQRQGGIRVLCPVCLKKLKSNLKFDAGERFTNLAKACEELGFNEEAAVYRALVKAAPASTVSPRGGSVRPTASPRGSGVNRLANANSRTNRAASSSPKGSPKASPKGSPRWK